MKEEQKDWRSALRDLVSQKKPAQPPQQEAVEDTRKEVADLIENVVLPAFQELKAELENLDRTVEIDRRQYQASLTVHYHGREEFSYAIRGHVYHKMSFAFPEIVEGKTKRISKAEVVLRGGPRSGYEVHKFTKEGIIRDFLKEYKKWMGW